MGNFLYRCREDGTCNEQLTDYSVVSLSVGGKVKNNKLYFKDSEFEQHSINL